jgi:hypothetical protein
LAEQGPLKPKVEGSIPSRPIESPGNLGFRETVDRDDREICPEWKVVCLATIDPASLAAPGHALAALLPDAGESPAGSRKGAEVLSEEQIAGLLAQLCSESTWVALATCGDDERSRAELARRALELFHKTQGFLSTRADMDTPGQPVPRA